MPASSRRRPSRRGRAAVARLIAHRLAQGQSPCSAETGAYCQARKRLPEKFVSELARQTGRALEADEPRRKKRRPKPFDCLMKPRQEAKREMLQAFAKTKCHSSDARNGHAEVDDSLSPKFR